MTVLGLQTSPEQKKNPLNFQGNVITGMFLHGLKKFCGSEEEQDHTKQKYKNYE